MKVTVCELPDNRSAFLTAWHELVEHVAAERSDFVLLPAMPFCRWFARSWHSDAAVWRQALQEHDAWESRLYELAPAMVAATRPVDFGYGRYEEGFVWDIELGFRAVHAKANPRDEHGFYEARWYQGATPDFIPAELKGVLLAFLLGDELWWLEESQLYSLEGVQLLLVPRSTEPCQAWLEAGRRAAGTAHAYQLSSNRAGSRHFGGGGWIIDPDGEVLGCTDAKHPFLTAVLDIPAAAALPRPLGIARDILGA